MAIHVVCSVALVLPYLKTCSKLVCPLYKCHLATFDHQTRLKMWSGQDIAGEYSEGEAGSIPVPDSGDRSSGSGVGGGKGKGRCKSGHGNFKARKGEVSMITFSDFSNPRDHARGRLERNFRFFLHHFALETWKREVISLLNFKKYLP